MIIFMYDILYIIISPLIFFIVLPKSIEKIHKFIENNTENINGLGDVCSFSNFSNHNKERIVGDKNKKLTNSYINYKMNNPDWNSEKIKLEGIKEKRNISDYFLGHNHDEKIKSYLYDNGNFNISL